MDITHKFTPSRSTGLRRRSFSTKDCCKELQVIWIMQTATAFSQAAFSTTRFVHRETTSVSA